MDLFVVPVAPAVVAAPVEPGRLDRPRSCPRPPTIDRCRGASGQTTAEYALVLLGAATIAMLVVTWASSSGTIGKLFDAVISHVIGAVT